MTSQYISFSCPIKLAECPKCVGEISKSLELWPKQGFLVCVHCDLDFGDMTLG